MGLQYHNTSRTLPSASRTHEDNDNADLRLLWRARSHHGQMQTETSHHGCGLLKNTRRKLPQVQRTMPVLQRISICSINMSARRQMLPRTLLYAVHGPRRKRKETLTPRLPPSKLQDQTLNGQYRLALFTIQVNADPYPSWVSNYQDQTRNSLALNV